MSRDRNILESPLEFEIESTVGSIVKMLGSICFGDFTVEIKLMESLSDYIGKQ